MEKSPKMGKALILVDIQNDYFPKGNMELVGAVMASMQAQKILYYFREKEWPIFHVQHIAVRAGATFFLPNTKGMEIHDTVKPLINEKIIIKHYPNSFRETELLLQLQQQKINELFIIGMMTHMCIDSTVRAAFDFGFKITLLQDACATRDLVIAGDKVPARLVQQAFLAALKSPFATLSKVSEFCKK